MGFVSDVKKALGIGAGAAGRKKRLDENIDAQSEGNSVPGATFGNPNPTPRKKKSKPISSRNSIPTTLRG